MLHHGDSKLLLMSRMLSLYFDSSRIEVNMSLVEKQEKKLRSFSLLLLFRFLAILTNCSVIEYNLMMNTRNLALPK